MRNNTELLLGMFLICGALAVADPLLVGQDVRNTDDVAVVVNAQNAISDIKLATLRHVLLGEQSIWGNRLSISLIVPSPGTPEQDAVLRFVAMTAPQLKQHWMTKVYRGEAASEPIAASTETASAFVASHSGAIAFVRGADVPRDLKVLKVNGISPGEEGYPLR